MLFVLASARAWHAPQSLATWDDLDGAVADGYAGLTSSACIYPPGARPFDIDKGCRFWILTATS